MAALRGGHPGQHDEILWVALDGRVKPGHDVDQANPTLNVIPAKAGICPGLLFGNSSMLGRIPAYAGMTVKAVLRDDGPPSVG
jgi:hypothetical protein